ncbi:MAG: hypothetical protein K2Q12_07725 [Rickettsiales bacterium]|nr:hypothetical protein [Rickettsiales bacterium]
MSPIHSNESSPSHAMLAACRHANTILRNWFDRAAASDNREAFMGTIVKSNDYAHYGYEDVVTQADQDSEEAILPHLRACRDIPIVAEESCPNCADWPDGTQRWLVDPLDGTSRFKKGLQDFSVTLALQTKKGGRWITDIGMVSVPMEDKIYVADHERAYVVHQEDKAPLTHQAIEPVAFSGGIDDALRGKTIEIVSYSKKNQTIIKMREKLLSGPFHAQASFSTALVMAKMAEPNGVDGVMLAGNALDYDWDIHAAQHIAEKAGIFSKEGTLDGEPVVFLAKSKAILRALEMRFKQLYCDTKAELETSHER